ncbi:hypothetical protein Y032_0066g3690 [Ancylostoma ceylanicum]|uniref:Uncharacterized protein n=1 Tax=Ancylostoma ceylanicum TaxID=53326 RepID=A0A016TZP6_9BILA|nr:hypothetical protein Y032_0066g3690 [Ancylostoma ceylanicum]
MLITKMVTTFYRNPCFAGYATMSDSQLELLESSFESLVGADDDVEDMIADTPLVVPLENSSDGEDDDGEESGGSDSD